jgi:beta-galactosidase
MLFKLIIALFSFSFIILGVHSTSGKLPGTYSEDLSSNSVVTFYEELQGKPFSVAYDHRSLLFDGRRVLLLSGVIHYPRSTPAMWDDLMLKAKQNGLNTIQTYVFWNFHERKEGEYYFAERGDLLLYLEKAKKHGLFVNLRIGPYVDAEWAQGGIPLWLTYIPGMAFRCYNKPFMNYMGNWVKFIVNLVRPYFAPNGGPIVLLQIENEYWDASQWPYIEWCGELAASLQTGIPWEMCNGLYANNTIETCNSCDCASWIATHWSRQPHTPPIWTENEGWFDQWGVGRVIRSPEDVARSVARFFAYGGNVHTYYMWFGGNHYGSWGASGVTTMYANDVLLHSDGTPNEPKYSHLGRLHQLIIWNAHILLNNEVPLPQPVLIWNRNLSRWVNASINLQNIRTFGNPLNESSFSFLSNDENTTALVFWKDKSASYQMPPYSVTLINGSGYELYNTAKVRNVPKYNKTVTLVSKMSWRYWPDVNRTASLTVSNPTPIEQLLLTFDKTDYLYYRTLLTVKQLGVHILRVTTRRGNSLIVFLDRKYQSQQYSLFSEVPESNINATFALEISSSGPHVLEILSVSLGLFKEVDNTTHARKGIVGDVFLDDQNITKNGWLHRIALNGQTLQIYTKEGSARVPWSGNLQQSVLQPLQWYQTKFTLSKEFLSGTNNTEYRPVLIDLSSMYRGHVWINGNDIGRYWLLPGNCSFDWFWGCTVFDRDCCNKPTQSLYHIPPDWLHEGENLLTLFEEIGGDPTNISIVTKVKNSS